MPLRQIGAGRKPLPSHSSQSYGSGAPLCRRKRASCLPRAGGRGPRSSGAWCKRNERSELPVNRRPRKQRFPLLHLRSVRKAATATGKQNLAHKSVQPLGKIATVVPKAVQPPQTAKAAEPAVKTMKRRSPKERCPPRQRAIYPRGNCRQYSYKAMAVAVAALYA
jgi:hypothetical protein